MGVEAYFQAMPEDCELFIAARQDREIAEMMQFFNNYSERDVTGQPEQYRGGPKSYEFHFKARKVAIETPGLRDRYFYAGGRTFDAIVYLLSPARRATPREKDTSLIHQAFYGQEPLYPEAIAVQGIPIGLVPSAGVVQIADYLGTISREILHEQYGTEHIKNAGIYKSAVGEDRFQVIWDEFVGMRDVYQAAAEHNEAVITVID
jgi:hypothetical protein